MGEMPFEKSQQQRGPSYGYLCTTIQEDAVCPILPPRNWEWVFVSAQISGGQHR